MIQIFQTPTLVGERIRRWLNAVMHWISAICSWINPGSLRGNVLLKGPRNAGHLSVVARGATRGDDDMDDDGIPTRSNYGIYWTRSRRSPWTDPLRATYTAASGVGYGDFPGEFQSVTSSYEGQYNLVLADEQRSSIGSKNISPSRSHAAITNEQRYFSNILQVSEDDTNDVELIPACNDHDVAYCMSEVTVVFRSTSGAVLPAEHSFQQRRICGHRFSGPRRQYSVNVESMSGTPLSSDTASNIGSCMYLPLRHYHLNPSVTPAGGNAQTG